MLKGRLKLIVLMSILCVSSAYHMKRKTESIGGFEKIYLISADKQKVGVSQDVAMQFQYVRDMLEMEDGPTAIIPVVKVNAMELKNIVETMQKIVSLEEKWKQVSAAIEDVGKIKEEEKLTEAWARLVELISALEREKLFRGDSDIVKELVREAEKVKEELIVFLPDERRKADLIRKFYEKLGERLKTAVSLVARAPSGVGIPLKAGYSSPQQIAQAIALYLNLDALGYRPGFVDILRLIEYELGIIYKHRIERAADYFMERVRHSTDEITKEVAEQAYADAIDILEKTPPRLLLQLEIGRVCAFGTSKYEVLKKNKKILEDIKKDEDLSRKYNQLIQKDYDIILPKYVGGKLRYLKDYNINLSHLFHVGVIKKKVATIEELFKNADAITSTFYHMAYIKVRDQIARYIIKRAQEEGFDKWFDSVKSNPYIVALIIVPTVQFIANLMRKCISLESAGFKGSEESEACKTNLSILREIRDSIKEENVIKKIFETVLEKKISDIVVFIDEIIDTERVMGLYSRNNTEYIPSALLEYILDGLKSKNVDATLINKMIQGTGWAPY